MRLTPNAALAFGLGVFGAAMSSGVRADPIDPCSALTPGQVAAVLGVPAVKASSGNNRCIWVPTKYGAQGSPSVTLQLQTADGFAAQRARPDATPIGGIGDEALQTSRPAAPPVLTVRMGNVYFALSVHLPPDQAIAAEQSLARQVLFKP